MARQQKPTICSNTAGIDWSDFVAVKQEPGSCNGETEASWDLSYLGYTVEMNPEPPAILSRMAYRAEIVNYFSDLTSVEPPDACPTYEDNLTICFNKAASTIVTPLISPPTGKSVRWMLDKEELIPFNEQGCLIMMHRLTYICEGPWYIIDWNSTDVSSYNGTSMLITPEFQEAVNVWLWDHATIQHQKHSPEVKYRSTFPVGWKKNPVGALPLDYYDKSGYTQKMIKCNIKKYIKNITSFTSPTCAIPVNFAGDSIQALANGPNVLEIYTPTETFLSGRRFRMSGESIVPYSTKGGGMIEWNREYTYQCDPVFYSTVYDT